MHKTSNARLALKLATVFAAALLSNAAFSWGYLSGNVDLMYVNTYGNYSSGYLQNGFCFKISGYQDHLKMKYAESGEQNNNLELTQAIVLAAKLSGKQVKATYVDWGNDTSCRFEGTSVPAKWIETIRILD